MATALTDRRPPLLTPTYANPLAVLIAGGPADVTRELSAWLTPRGLYVTDCWPSERTKPGPFNRPIPAGIDLVIIIVSYLGHGKQDAVIRSCRKAGVRFVRTAWNRGKLTAALATIGIQLATPHSDFDPIPLHEEAVIVTPRATRCARIEGGRRCQRDAAVDDTLCSEHRSAFDAARSSPPFVVASRVPAPAVVVHAAIAPEPPAVVVSAAIAPEPPPAPLEEPIDFSALAANIAAAPAESELVPIAPDAFATLPSACAGCGAPRPVAECAETWEWAVVGADVVCPTCKAALAPRPATAAVVAAAPVSDPIIDAVLAAVEAGRLAPDKAAAVLTALRKG